MGHIPDDDNLDEFMNASGEEWSKPELPRQNPIPQKEESDRWGSPLPQDPIVNGRDRWGSEPIKASPPKSPKDPNKKSSKWWIIVLIIVVVLCLCLAAFLIGLPILGINLFQGNLF